MIDGANRWQSVWYVTVPLLGTTIRTTSYLSILGSLTQFNLVWIMTRGGPVNASEMMATYMYRYAFIRLTRIRLSRGAGHAGVLPDLFYRLPAA